MRNCANNRGKAESVTMLSSSKGRGITEEMVYEKSGFPHSGRTETGYINSKEAFPDKDPSALHRRMLWRITVNKATETCHLQDSLKFSV